ncbi:MAG: hypothetical protein C0403_11980 [Desulfobacterium sp.]|nr:hypothetical protein [Desulfobacterium sp.]
MISQIQKYFLTSILLILLFTCGSARAEDDWFVSIYAGKASDNNLADIFLGETKWVYAQVLVLATGKKLWEYEDYLTLEAEGQVAWKWGYEIYEDEEQYKNTSSANPGYDWAEGYSYESQNTGFNKHNEFNLLLALRWQKFPWNNHIKTSFGFGEGLSYATEKPPLEKDPHNILHPALYENSPNDKPYDTSQLLNYLMFDMTFALPDYPQYQTFFRIHHRSGIFRLMNGYTCGSNYLTAGFRYQFSWPKFDISTFREFNRTTKW